MNASEPSPLAADTPAPAADTVAPAVDESGVWYCDQCGARYSGPGSCQNQHEPADLVELSLEAAAELGQDPAPDAAKAEPAQADTTTPPPAEAPLVEQTANLGLATTLELLDELEARAQIGGYADYKPAG